MKRKIMNQLIKWKQREERYPFVLSGIKGVGKTHIALEFAKAFYEGNLYINFETNAKLCLLFEQNNAFRTPADFGVLLCSFYQVPDELLSHILIMLDELPACPPAYTAFLEWIGQRMDLSVLVITSREALLSEAVCRRFECHRLFPFEFDEFLTANGYEWYVEVILAHSQNNRKIPDIVHKELLTLFEDYLFVGGMPAAINEYLNTESSENINEIHQNIFNHIRMTNFFNYSESESLKMQQIFDVMESQLLKENQKFQYKLIRKGATHTMYKDAIFKLSAMEQLIMYNRMAALENGCITADDTAFRLYYFDVGILNSLLERNKTGLIISEDQKKRVVLENYVMQSLHSKNITCFFWESNSQAKIDFLIQCKEGIIPIEVRSSHNVRSRSVSVFRTLYEIPYSIKLSDKNFEIVNQIKYVPYYSLFNLYN